MNTKKITVDALKMAQLINRIQVWTEIRLTEDRKSQIVAQAAIMEAEADLIELGVPLPGGRTAEQLRTRSVELAAIAHGMPEANNEVAA